MMSKMTQEEKAKAMAELVQVKWVEAKGVRTMIVIRDDEVLTVGLILEPLIPFDGWTLVFASLGQRIASPEMTLGQAKREVEAVLLSHLYDNKKE